MNITTQYTRTQNKENGRRGYGNWKKEKITSIQPKEYGMFLEKKKRRD